MSSSTSSFTPSRSSVDDDKAFLLENGMKHSPNRTQKLLHRFNLRNAALFLNIALFVTSLALWFRVYHIMEHFACDPNSKPFEFEPDCKLQPSLTESNVNEAVRYDSRVTFQPHHFYGGSPSNETDEIWRRLSPPGDGIVEVPNEFTKGLPPSLPAPEHPDTHKVYISPRNLMAF